MKNIFSSLKVIFKDSIYWYIAIGSSALMAYISYWLFYQTTTISDFLSMTQNGDFGRFSYAYSVTYIITTLLIIILSGISLSVTFWLYKHSKLSRAKITAGNTGGLIAGIFSMACPVCGSFLFSLIGVAGGLAIFPLQGLELKFLSIALLVFPIIYVAKKVDYILDCQECNDVTVNNPDTKKLINVSNFQTPQKQIALPMGKILIFILAVIFLINQGFLTKVAANMGLVHKKSIIPALFSIRTKTTQTIIAPKLNPDGKTTSLVEQPTITEVPANPNTGDALADAKVVMIPIGKPFYAPEDISFDDPINAQKKWKSIGFSMKLTPEQETRWKGLTSTFTCNYCCGGPNNVTVIGRCGCAHSYAWQGFFRYMIVTYGDKYTDDQLKGEAFRWSGIWYPKGVLEDYLLATGKSEALPHHSHGGVGSDGRHGL